MEAVTIYETSCTFDGDGKLLKIGLQAYSLGIVYEFDPCFGLSISRIDPLPHQLEAIYDYLLKLPSAPAHRELLNQALRRNGSRKGGKLTIQVFVDLIEKLADITLKNVHAVS